MNVINLLNTTSQTLLIRLQFSNRKIQTFNYNATDNYVVNIIRIISVLYDFILFSQYCLLENHNVAKIIPTNIIYREEEKYPINNIYQLKNF